VSASSPRLLKKAAILVRQPQTDTGDNYDNFGLGINVSWVDRSLNHSNKKEQFCDLFATYFCGNTTVAYKGK
jgi:hypothetical protein